LLRVAHREVWHEYPDYVIPIPVDRTVRDGETVMLDGVAVRAVLTPGHTRDSTSYLIRTTSGTAAFIGDLLLSDTEGPGWWGSADFSTETTLESLEKLLAFKPDRVYCGHGPVRGCGWKFLKKALAKGQAGEWELGEVEWHWDVKPPPSFTRRNARSPGETAAPRGADRRKIHGRHPGTPEGRENAAKGAPVRR
jgi:glyoxylase-like metal-dependent hydrolase (beta-lactamase superfamily II)